MRAGARFACWRVRRLGGSRRDARRLRGRSAEDLGMRMIYDVAHNTAKLEKHTIDGKERKLLVHRKGATRAFGPGHEEVAARYRDIGQPVIIGGSMETGSYLLVGTSSGAQTFFSTAHGSGRRMSRTKRANYGMANSSSATWKRAAFTSAAPHGRASPRRPAPPTRTLTK